MTDIQAMARERRHTLYFLDGIRGIAPVFLDTEVDMTGILAHRQAMQETGVRLSTVAYVLRVAGQALTRHPEANAAVRGRWRQRVARYDRVNGKITFDKTFNGQRVVASTVVPDVDRAELAELQARIERIRDGDPDELPEFAGIRLLHRLPQPLAKLAFWARTRPLAGRDLVLGTFAVTSLGHRPVDGFHSVGGTTVTIGIGRTVERPVVRDSAIVVAPVLRLSLTFDHRVIDGAEAADLLADIREGLESVRPAQ